MKLYVTKENIEAMIHTGCSIDRTVIVIELTVEQKEKLKIGKFESLAPISIQED